MDKETLDIKRAIQLVGEMVGHEGWEIVARSLQASLLENESLESVEVKDPEQLFLEIKSRQMAKKIIAGWLQDIMGTAQLADEQVTEIKASYIINKED